MQALSERQREIADLLVQGSSTARIAALLVISPKTVRNHVQAIMTRTGTHSRVAAVAALRHEPLWAARPAEC